MGRLAVSGAYAPSNASDLVWTAAKEMDNSVGASSFSASTFGASSNRISGWFLDDTTAEALLFAKALPAHWLTFNVEVWWAIATANTGDVVWSPQHVQVGAGTTLLTEVVGANVAATAGATEVVVVTTVLSAVARTADLLRLELLRNAANGGDTLVGDAGVLGVMLRKVT